jgi:hypothetical protein
MKAGRVKSAMLFNGDGRKYKSISARLGRLNNLRIIKYATIRQNISNQQGKSIIAKNPHSHAAPSSVIPLMAIPIITYHEIIK